MVLFFFTPVNENIELKNTQVLFTKHLWVLCKIESTDVLGSFIYVFAYIL